MHLEVADAVATLTLDSPHNRNALSARLLDELDAGLADAASDPRDGRTAASIGLVTAVADDVDAELAGYLTAFRAASPQGLAESKKLVAEPMRRALAERGDAMVELSGRLFASAEGQEGIRSFLERRPPAWAVVP